MHIVHSFQTTTFTPFSPTCLVFALIVSRALDDAILYVSIIPKVYIIQNNGVLYHTVVSHKYFLKITEFSTVPLIMLPLPTRLFFTTAPGLYFAGG